MSFSVTEPSLYQKWFAGVIVVTYALITLLPLVWIIATGFKSSSDSIAYPPKVVFEPTVEGYVNLFTTQTRMSSKVATEPTDNFPWFEKIVREKGNTIVGPSRFSERFFQLCDYWVWVNILCYCARDNSCLCIFQV